MRGDSPDRSEDFLLQRQLARLSHLNPRYLDSTGILFNVHLVPPSRTDLNVFVWVLLYTGCQCLNRSLSRLLDEPSVSFWRFTAETMISASSSDRFQRYPVSRYRIVQECTSIYAPYTTSQIKAYGWSTGQFSIEV